MICCALLRTNAHLVAVIIVLIMLPAEFEIPFSMLQPPLVDCLLAPLCVWSHRAMLGGKWCVFDLAFSGHFLVVVYTQKIYFCLYIVFALIGIGSNGT